MIPRQKNIPKNLLQAYLDGVSRHPVVAILCIAAITMLLSWQLPRLSFQTTVYDLIIEDLPEARNYEDFRTIFGSDEIIRVVIKAEDVLEVSTFAKISQLSDQFGQIPGVRRILSLPEVKKSVDTGSKWSLDQFSAMLAPLKLMERNLISSDRKTTIITLVLSREADKAAVIASVEDQIAIAGKDLALYQTGIPLVSEALADYTKKDFFYLTPITLAVIAFLLVGLFRNMQSVLLPIGCVVLSIGWTFGLMAWVGVPVTMLTIIVPVFLIAVGTAYCLHVCSDYLEQSRNTEVAGTVVRATYHHVAFPVTLAVLTTMIGIGSLAINKIPAIREFALFACFGMLSLLIIVLTFFPAILTLVSVPGRRTTHQRLLDTFIDRILKWIVTLNLRHQKVSLSAIGALAAVCLVGVFFIQVETNPVSFFKQGSSVRHHFHDIYTDMSGSFPVNVYLEAQGEDYFEEPANLSHITRMQAFLDQLPGVDKTISLVDYLKLVNYAANNFNADYYALPSDVYEMRYLLNHFKMLLGADLLRRFLSSDHSRVNLLMLTHISSSSDFLETQSKVLDYARSELDSTLKVDVTGLGMVIAASSHLLTTGQIKSLSVSLILIFAVMLTLFLSSRVGLIALLPNLFPIVVNFGIMGLFGVRLSVATSLIASVAIGLAVDDTIHYLVRYNSEFKKDLDKDRAMRDTVLHVGRPILFTSLTISLGFAVLIFSSFQPTVIFGFLMVITMMAALVGDLILLPAMMMHVELVTAWDLLKTIPTVGRISPGMVHELNQPLNAIKVGSDFLKIMAKRGTSVSPEQMVAVSQEIGDQVERASNMIRRFSKVAQPSEPAREPLQISAPIQETVDILENQIKLDNIELSVDLAESLPPIAALHSRMVQAIYHLALNAWEAIIERKKQDPSNHEHRISIGAIEAKGEVLITIKDTGVGVADHHINRIFEPFFTTKAEGLGKGLGLTVVNQIVRELGGRIRIDSRSGQGTTITLFLPAFSE
jgi:hydrophobe/amphiphile efflux-3 (HAE3) family protein